MVRQLLTGTAALAIAVAINGPLNAADMPVKSAPYAAPKLFDWSGFYIGGHLGWTSAGFASTISQPSLGTQRGKGIVGGLQLGYNVQSGIWVWGLEGDLSAVGGIHKAVSDNRFTTDLLASIRARLGIAQDRVLYYVTGGFGYVKGKVFSSTFVANGVSYGKVVPVWGAGIEWAAAQNLTYRVEFLDFFGSHGIGGEDGGGNKLKDVYQIRFALNYKFDGMGWGKTPLVAKY